MAKRIEIFTADTHLCHELTKQVNAVVCNKCEVVLYPLNSADLNTVAKEKAMDYAIQAVPSIVVDGKLENLMRIKKQLKTMNKSR
ncbi:hypothetical protein NCCP2222_04790 [Sporosarcina sp. NCCP-2222]|uniref:hypothetical protein n=1 Tax=Sporosarcina sp. NCCP-2222 TaxID=2935073 RepID=UPI0020877D99|nr:hypothetical protein [Sporosarcina sp. NCCP-2222]GKV54532.1 hypothetical protein NCCP2222_04790 [Sporosarcina sp. NCCP-2222]